MHEHALEFSEWPSRSGSCDQLSAKRPVRRLVGNTSRSLLGDIGRTPTGYVTEKEDGSSEEMVYKLEHGAILV
jgi:hypothetical protein